MIRNCSPSFNDCYRKYARSRYSIWIVNHNCNHSFFAIKHFHGPQESLWCVDSTLTVRFKHCQNHDMMVSSCYVFTVQPAVCCWFGFRWNIYSLFCWFIFSCGHCSFGRSFSYFVFFLLFVLFVFVRVQISSVDFDGYGFDSPFEILLCGCVLLQLCLWVQIARQAAEL